MTGAGIFWIVWLAGGAATIGWYAYDCKVTGEKFRGDVMWVAILLWWLALPCMVGEALAERNLRRRAASGMSASGQDAQRLEAQPASPTVEDGDAR